MYKEKNLGQKIAFFGMDPRCNRFNIEKYNKKKINIIKIKNKNLILYIVNVYCVYTRVPGTFVCTQFIYMFIL